MTREQAQSELDLLGPQESKAWEAVKVAMFSRDMGLMKREQERQQFKATQDEAIEILNKQHHDLYVRTQKLRSFLELI